MGRHSGTDTHGTLTRAGGAALVGGLVAVLLWVAPSSAGGTSVGEEGDAGQTVATAQQVDDAATSITGVADSGDADLYRICVGDEGFVASTVNDALGLDTALRLFDADGVGVWSNDDADGSFGSRITDPDLPAGTYHLAVTHTNQYPANAAGRRIFPRTPWNAQLRPMVSDAALAAWGYRHWTPRAGYRIDLEGVTGCDVTIPVDVDVKPDSDRDRLNAKARGVVPVALLGSRAVDVTTIDPASLAFGPGGAGVAHRAGHLEDIDADGDVDLLVHFSMSDSGLSSGDEQVCVTGSLADGSSIEGCTPVEVR